MCVSRTYLLTLLALIQPYAVPNPRALSAIEASSVHHMLLLRHQVHSSPLYTSKRAAQTDPTAPRKTYGQAQMNAVYGVKNKASLDPFTAMPTYSQKFVREERALPDWSGHPICRELFPPELLDTIDAGSGRAAGGVGGAGGGGPRKKRKLELSRVSALPNAEEAFGMPSLEDDGADEDGVGGASSGQNLLDKLEQLREEEGDEVEGAEEEEAPEEDEEDEVYDDEDAGDYDAENYFDNGDDMGDDYGDGDDGEGTY